MKSKHVCQHFEFFNMVETFSCFWFICGPQILAVKTNQRITQILFYYKFMITVIMWSLIWFQLYWFFFFFFLAKDMLPEIVCQSVMNSIVQVVFWLSFSPLLRWVPHPNISLNHFQIGLDLPLLSLYSICYKIVTGSSL